MPQFLREADFSETFQRLLPDNKVKSTQENKVYL